jgi:hypothetical protein
MQSLILTTEIHAGVALAATIAEIHAGVALAAIVAAIAAPT